jgi:signal transduction histidine kinase
MHFDSNPEGVEPRPTSTSSEARTTFEAPAAPREVAQHARSGVPALVVERSRWAHAPYLVLVLGLCLTAAGGGLLRASAEMREQRQLRALTEQTVRSVAGRLDEHVRLMRAGAALAESAPERALASIAPPGCDAGVFSVARRAPLVSAREGAADALPSAEGEAFPIIAVTSCGRREARERGADLAADPVRRAAMDRARDSGEPTLAPSAPRAGLGHEKHEERRDHREAREEREAPSSGVVIFAPFYEASVVSDTIAARRAALAGFVVAELDVDELLGGPIADRAVDVALYQQGTLGTQEARSAQGEALPPGHSLPEDALLARGPRVIGASADEARPAARSHLTRAARFEAAGAPLTLVLQTQPAFHETAQRGLVPILVVTGMLLSALLFFATRAEVAARLEAERREGGLRALQRALEESEARALRLGIAESEAQKRAETAARLRDEFLATLSHELRTPLTAVMGWVGMLRRGSVRREAFDRGLEVIERNARLEAQLIEDLLDITAILGGELRLVAEPTEVAPVIVAVAAAIAPYARESGVALSVDASSCEGRVSGEAGRLRQVFWHLIHNAVRFTPRGGTVSVVGTRSSGELEIVVADTGKGIAPAFLPFVFDRFRQADGSRTRAQGGLGIGLALVRHIVELLGGTVTAESPGEGHGARFTVRLPLLRISVRRVVVDDCVSPEASPP